ncbi:methyltransferase domain-containing protein [uncultured Methanobrevibacter sp.]|uniref:methyltransferase domain-containing protein n=1 Tax=uncultured Methanobrevibacter sp. TaxID=253161 RepID=UPI00261EA918
MIDDYDFLTTCDISGFIKEDIRALVLYKSEINENKTVVDINSGVGELSSEFSNIAKKVTIIDKNPMAIEFSKKNISKFGNIGKAEFINDDELNGLDEIDNFDLAILKPKDENIDEILERIHEKLNSKGKIIIITNIMDFFINSVNKLSDLLYNPKITQVNISNGQLLNKGVKMESQNPMIIITVKKR